MNSLFQPQDLPPKVVYEKIFDQIPSLGKNPTRKRGRPSFPRDAIRHPLISKNLRRLPSLNEPAFKLKNNPALAET